MDTSRNLVLRSKLVIRSSSVIGSKIGVMSVTVDDHIPECHVTFERGGLFDEIPMSTIKLPEGRFQTFPDISLSEELR